MTYETKITPAMHGGQKLETTIKLGNAPADSMNDEPGERVLVIATRKGDKGISTFASVCIERTRAQGYAVRTHALYGDYSGTIQRAPAGTRATLKNLQALHDEALKQAPALVARCMAHYYPEALASREGEAAHA